MSDIGVLYEGGDRLRVRIRGHELVADQPVADGGEDVGPSPTELFVASLAACIGFYAERYLRRHSLPVEGLAVECDFAFAKDRPARVGSADLRLVLPAGFPEERQAGLLAVVEHCTVHNSIRQAPEISISLRAEQPVP
ncbi:MAG TPA: OsmC family protein [Actinomycetota bacterium]